MAMYKAYRYESVCTLGDLLENEPYWRERSDRQEWKNLERKVEDRQEWKVWLPVTAEKLENEAWLPHGRILKKNKKKTIYKNKNKINLRTKKLEQQEQEQGIV